MFSWVEHEIIFITLGPDRVSQNALKRPNTHKSQMTATFWQLPL